MGKGVSVKTYKLLAADGATVTSRTPGTLGGNSKAGICGRLDCYAANGALSKGYAKHRAFFASEQDAIQACYRTCGRCMTSQYKDWKSGPEGKESYLWKQLPKWQSIINRLGLFPAWRPSTENWFCDCYP